MTTKNDFMVYLMESLEHIGHVKSRAMFGGFGIFKDNTMFGLVDNDTFYLKVDEENRHDFESRGLKPFTYRRGNKEYAMSYYQAPEDALDDIEVLSQWVQRAIDTAVRSSVHKKR
ncbi:TfoX/Sxy family protein [Chloroflexota bacterium]